MPSSINRDLCVLSTMFTVLIEAEVFHNPNPVRGIRKLKIQNTEMAFLSDDEIERLLERLPGLWRFSSHPWSFVGRTRTKHLQNVLPVQQY
ncbi:TPA: hypothetical protein ACGA1N_005134 [Escherichia coli]